MHQWKVILATVLIFGSGVGTGHLLSRRDTPQQPAPPSNPTNNFSPGNSSNGIQGAPRPLMFRSHGYLVNHLKLTDEQKEQLHQIRKAGHDRVREFGNPFREQIMAENQRVREEIRAILTPEQARNFDRLPHFRINPEAGRPGIGRPPHHHPSLPHTNGPRTPRPQSQPEGPSATPAVPPEPTFPSRSAAA